MVRQELPLRYGYSVTCTRFTLTWADITAGTTPQSVNLADAGGNAFQVGAGGIVLGLRIKPDIIFSGGAMASLVLTIGSQTTSQNAFFLSAPNAVNLMATVADNTETFVNAFKAPTNAAFGINVTFTGDGAANFNTLTAGQFHIDVFLLQFGPINAVANGPTVTP